MNLQLCIIYHRCSRVAALLTNASHERCSCRLICRQILRFGINKRLDAFPGLSSIHQMRFLLHYALLGTDSIELSFGFLGVADPHTESLFSVYKVINFWPLLLCLEITYYRSYFFYNLCHQFLMQDSRQSVPVFILSRQLSQLVSESISI